MSKLVDENGVQIGDEGRRVDEDGALVLNKDQQVVYAVIRISYDKQIDINSLSLYRKFSDAIVAAKNTAASIYTDGISEDVDDEEIELVKKCIDENGCYLFGENEPGVFIVAASIK